MKLKSLLAPITTTVVALAGLVTLFQPTVAQSQQTRNFYCGMTQGYPATLVRTPRGPVPLIVWVDRRLETAGWPPERRCHHVSDKFQAFNDNGRLGYLKAGTLNGSNVICATGTPSGACTSDTVLLTLFPDMNPGRSLSQLVNTRMSAYALPLYIDGKLIENLNRVEMTEDSHGFSVVDVNEWIGDTQENW